MKIDRNMRSTLRVFSYLFSHITWAEVHQLITGIDRPLVDLFVPLSISLWHRVRYPRGSGRLTKQSVRPWAKKGCVFLDMIYRLRYAYIVNSTRQRIVCQMTAIERAGDTLPDTGRTVQQPPVMGGRMECRALRSRGRSPRRRRMRRRGVIRFMDLANAPPTGWPKTSGRPPRQ